MHTGQGKKVVGDVLQRLIDYTVHHFASEEALMEQNGYPDLAKHQAEHRALTDKVVAFQQEFNAGPAVITSELMTFLQQWLTVHIHNIDRRQGEFINAKGSN
jgi:hemerythrin